MPKSYGLFFLEIKKRVQTERLRVVLASNAALVLMYWDIGKGILEKQKEEGWGSKVIDRLSSDLAKEFPDMTGFSPRNLKNTALVCAKGIRAWLVPSGFGPSNRASSL